MSDEWMATSEVDTDPQKWLFSYAAYGMDEMTGTYALMAMMVIHELTGGEHDFPDSDLDSMLGVDGAWDFVLKHAAGERKNITLLTPLAIEAAAQLLAYVGTKHPALAHRVYEVALKILYRAVVEGHRINE